MGLGWVDGSVVGLYLLVITVVGVAPSLWPLLKRRWSSSSTQVTRIADEDSINGGAGDFPLTALTKAPSTQLPTQDDEEDGDDDGDAGAASSMSGMPQEVRGDGDGQGEATEQYFLAGRSVGWWAVGMSLFSSNIGSEHFVGLAGSGAASGLAVGHFEINSPLFILLLGWVFVPYYLGTGVFTMPEFLEKRYNRYCRRWLGVVSLAAYVFTKIAVSLYAAAIIFDVVLDIDSQWLSAVAILLATSLYTMIGGLRGVVYTEVVQTVVLVVGAVLVLLFGLHEVGGVSEFKARLPDSYFHMIRPASDPEFPWTGIVSGYPVIAFWYWCTDQVIVQRVLAAKSVGHARSGTILASFFKLLPLFLLVIPGMLAKALYGEELAKDPNRAYPLLVVRLMPPGLQGLIVASMLAALMSSFASLFNSCSTIFTMDFYSKWRPDASPKQLVAVGRVATLGMTVLGLLWLPVVPKLSSQLYIYLQSVQGYIAAPITCVFVVGVLWRGANSTGAMACLTIGSLLGLLRLVAEITLGRHYEVGIPVLRLLYALFVGSNFLHFTCALFITCVGIIVAASHLAPLPHHNLPTIDTGPSPLPPLWPLLRRSFAGDAVDGAGPGSKPFSSRSRMAGYVGMSVVVVLSIAIIQVVFR